MYLILKKELIKYFKQLLALSVIFSISGAEKKAVEEKKAIAPFTAMMHRLGCDIALDNLKEDEARSYVQSYTYLKFVLHKAEFICFSCKTIADLKCGKCNAAVYCSVGCQRADWSAHRPICTGKALSLEQKMVLVGRGATIKIATTK
jgi:hypothetical protein